MVVLKTLKLLLYQNKKCKTKKLNEILTKLLWYVYIYIFSNKSSIKIICLLSPTSSTTLRTSAPRAMYLFNGL
jgi:hypothetical protein